MKLLLAGGTKNSAQMYKKMYNIHVGKDMSTKAITQWNIVDYNDSCKEIYTTNIPDGDYVLKLVKRNYTGEFDPKRYNWFSPDKITIKNGSFDRDQVLEQIDKIYDLCGHWAVFLDEITQVDDHLLQIKVSA